jgi:hypothetical protein
MEGVEKLKLLGQMLSSLEKISEENAQPSLEDTGSSS